MYLQLLISGVCNEVFTAVLSRLTVTWIPKRNVIFQCLVKTPAELMT